MEAEVKLSIRHGRTVYDGAPWIAQAGERAGIDVSKLLDGARVWSGSEQCVVHIATSLIEGVGLPKSLSGIDRAHVNLVRDAVAHAAGSSRGYELLLGEQAIPGAFDDPQAYTPDPEKKLPMTISLLTIRFVTGVPV